MSTTPPTQDQQRWQDLARGIETLNGQVQALSETVRRDTRRVSNLEQSTRQIQKAVTNLVQRQGIGASNGDRYESNSAVGKKIVPEGLADKTNFKQRSRRYRLVAGAKDEKFKVHLEWAEAHENRAPTVTPEASNVTQGAKFVQHVCEFSDEHGDR